jgi:N-acetylneuraminate synthase
MAQIRIGNTTVGDGQQCYIVAEIGINHNGSLDIAKKLIDAAVGAGCDAVKFQKRTIEVVYTSEELARPRENPFGPTNGDLKRGLEFGLFEYSEIARHCAKLGIAWFASCWDEGSVDFMDQFGPPCHKIASASLTDDELLRCVRDTGRPVVLSTGMSTLEEVDHAVDVLGPMDLVLLHTCSTYPSRPQELNLGVIQSLRGRYRVPVGYSGHELGVTLSTCAVAMGACVLERHITLDRTMWGSDQAASIEPNELKTLVDEVRTLEAALGDGFKRIVPSEVPIQEKLRRVGRAVCVAS